jgi:hypothetical protein
MLEIVEVVVVQQGEDTIQLMVVVVKIMKVACGNWSDETSLANTKASDQPAAQVYPQTN